MTIARLRAVEGYDDLIGKFAAGGISSYISSEVRAKRWSQVTVHSGAQVHRGTMFHTNDSSRTKRIIVGKRVFIGQNCFFSAGERIEIKQDSLIGASCNFLGAGHDYNCPTQPYATADVVSYGAIVIGPNAWVGTAVTIVGNVTVGFGSVVAAGTLVRASIPPLCLVGGNPAKVLKVFDWGRRGWSTLLNDDTLQEALARHINTLPTETEFLTYMPREG